jgi:MFS family permease
LSSAEDGSSQTGAARAWYAVAVLMLAYLLSLIDRIFLALLTDPIERSLHISDTEFGLLTGFAFALLYSVAGVPIGSLVDRGIAPNRIIAAGILVWTVMTALSGLAQDYWQLFAARIGVGVGEATLGPAAASRIADLFPRERLSKAMAVFTLGGILGSGAAYLLGTLTIDLVYRYSGTALPGIGPLAGWRLAFMAAASPGILMAVLVFMIREPRRPRRSTPEHSSPSLLDFLSRNRRAIALYLGAYACFNTPFYGVFAWLPALASRHYHLPINSVGASIGIVLITFGPLGAMAGGAAADGLTGRGRNAAHMQINCLACMGITLFAVAMPLQGSWGAAIVLLCGLYFCCSIVSALGISGLQLMTPPGLRARMTALFFLAINLFGMTTGPAVVAALTQHVFADPARVNHSLAVLGACFPLLAALVFACGVGRCRSPHDCGPRRSGWAPGLIAYLTGM